MFYGLSALVAFYAPSPGASECSETCPLTPHAGDGGVLGVASVATGARPPRLMRSVGRTEQPYMTNRRLNPSETQSRSRVLAARYCRGPLLDRISFYQHGKLDLNGVVYGA